MRFLYEASSAILEWYLPKLTVCLVLLSDGKGGGGGVLLTLQHVV